MVAIRANEKGEHHPDGCVYGCHDGEDGYIKDCECECTCEEVVRKYEEEIRKEEAGDSAETYKDS